MAQQLKFYAIYTKVLFLLLIFLFLQLISAGESESHVIETLPGYPETLPFKLETGYIGVGEDEDLQLFYYFVESEGDPEKDPLILWMNGGPGCSGLTGLVYEIGPLNFDLSSFDGSLPSFILNPYSWTKIASIIFIDAPVGAGFSYSNAPGYRNSDTKSTMNNYMFLRKWLLDHPSFVKNRMYLAGDSYGGKMVPMVAYEIAKGNEAGLQPRMNLQGYLIGNALTDGDRDFNEKVPYAHRMGLLSDEYYQLAKSSCNGEYVNPDPNNIQCSYALGLFKECTSSICTEHILEPRCTKALSPRSDDIKWGQAITEDVPDNFLFLSKHEQPWCRLKNYWPSYIWARDASVQESLHIRKGTKEEWIRCNRSLPYEFDIDSVLKYHKLLNEKGYQILAYSGDHDFLVPYMSTLKWIRSLNLSIEDEWRPWNVDGQVAGYTQNYRNGEAYITFATVKGAGHTAPEYMPKQCFAMVYRWLSSFPF